MMNASKPLPCQMLAEAIVLDAVDLIYTVGVIFTEGHSFGRG